MKEHKVVHLVTPYLFHTGSWIYSQIVGAKNFKQAVLTQRKINLDQFPLKDIYSIEDFNLIKRIINKFIVHYTGNYGLFFPKIAKKVNPSIFHAHMGFEAVRWLKFVRNTGVPLITTFYGQDVSRLGRIQYWHKKYQDLFEYGGAFLTEGNYLRGQLINLGCPENKVIVQHLGIDIDSYPKKEYTSSALKDSKIIILQVSSFVEKKGIEYSLEAISLLKEKIDNFEFRLIGGGDERSLNNIKEKIKALNIASHVKLLGVIKHRQMLDEMVAADIFLHPSVTAKDGDNEGGSPVGITEASGIGLPVVATLHADIPEVVKNNVTGFLVPERNSSMLAEKLAHLANDYALRNRFGVAGMQHIMENYNLNKQASKLEDIYRSIIQ